jgi:DNA-binding response OmpR family regulator
MPQTILIIDDSIPIHQLIKVHLDEESIEIQSAYNGTSGLSKAAALRPDLILLDVDLPDMNGFDVCRLLKADSATAHIPVIFVAGSSSIDAKVCGLDLQAIDYITKPFNPTELCARVRSALRPDHEVTLTPKPAVTAVVDAAKIFGAAAA